MRLPAAARRIPVRRGRRGGLQVYDVASIANKGVSQRIDHGAVSPLGHDTHIASKTPTCVALPTNQPIHPTRNTGDLMRREPGAAVPPDLQLRVHHRRGGRPDPHRRQHAGRRRAAQQLPQARADLESGRRAQRSAPHDRRRHYAYVATKPASWSSTWTTRSSRSWSPRGAAQRRARHRRCSSAICS